MSLKHPVSPLELSTTAAATPTPIRLKPYDACYPPTFVSDELVSVWWTGIGTFGGPAHYANDVWNFDVQGDLLTAGDLLSGDYEGLLRDLWKKRQAEDPNLGDIPDSFDFENRVGFRPEGVTLHFSASDVGPNFMYGAPTFLFDWSEMTPVIAGGSVVDRMANRTLVSEEVPPGPSEVREFCDGEVGFFG